MNWKEKLIVIVIVGFCAVMILIQYQRSQKSVVDTGGKEFGIVVGYAQGKLDGYEYEYQRNSRGSSCRLALKKESNKSEIVIYDADDNGTIGDNRVDEYAIKIGDFGITYARDYTAIRNKWEGEIIPRKEALEEATNILRDWQVKIELIHGCK